MKLRRKITLSAIALAACATTAFTSTYAWYVTNTSAKVSFEGGSTGSVESAGLLCSTTGTSGDWDTKFEGVSLTGSLKPLFYSFDSGIKFDELTEGADPGDGNDAEDGLSGKAKTAAAQKTAGGIVTFDIWLYSDSELTVTPTITVQNTTTEGNAELAKQTASKATGVPSGVTKGTKFVVDAFGAMYMAVQTKETAAVVDIYSANASADASAETPEILAFADAAASGNFMKIAATAASVYKSGGSAHDFYDANKQGHKLASAAKTNAALDSKTSAQSNVVLTAGKPTKITYTVWIEGSSDACFNSCAGQTFDVSVSFVKAGA